jgi:hypothetical protein
MCGPTSRFKIYLILPVTVAKPKFVFACQRVSNLVLLTMASYFQLCLLAQAVHAIVHRHELFVSIVVLRKSPFSIVAVG